MLVGDEHGGSANMNMAEPLLGILGVLRKGLTGRKGN